MRTPLLLSALLLIAAAGCASDDHDAKVPLSDVPANVRDTLTREAKGAPIGDVEKETEDGRLVYEADVVVDGQKREIAVAADGTLVHNKVDD